MPSEPPRKPVFPFYDFAFYYVLCGHKGVPGGTSAKESAYQCRRCGFVPWVGRIPWKRKWQPTPVFWPGESHEQKSLAGYSPRGCRESNVTASESVNDVAVNVVVLFYVSLNFV